ncbi:MAG TPA: SDR family oxidoreductase, partial [Candidatus Eremiobacteraceae bacterium]|nr:SDR family oxidoreductase [Candidatus Eremiobacteraceae bacterium]
MLGVANRWSIATAIARALHAHGASLMLTYEGERTREEVEKLAQELGNAPTTAADVAKDESIAALRDFVSARFGKLDVLVHSLAFARREELAGKYFATSRAGFCLALDISAY